MKQIRLNIVISTFLLILVSVTACNRDGNDSEFIYSADKNGNNIDIYKITTKDGESNQLTISEGSDVNPKWSPDKSAIAFLSDRNNQNMSLYVMDPDGETERSLFSGIGEIRDYSWGPGSKRIAVEVNSGGTEENIWIGVIEVSDGKITQLTTEDGDAYLGGWSPDGQWLLFSVMGGNDPGIRRKNPNGVDEVVITSGKDSNPIFSPDGNWITFNRATEDGSNDLYIYNVEEEKAENLSPDDYDENFVSWSPKSKMILFTSNKDGNTEIYAIDPMGNDEIRLTSNRITDDNPVWNGNGSRILFKSVNDGDFDVYSMDKNGKDQRRHTNTSYDIIDIDW